MRTKAVYVLVSSSEDIYLEQCFVSVWSLKQRNQSIKVQLVMDDLTKARWDEKEYGEFHELVDEIHVQEFEPQTQNKVRSRWLKTNLRNLIAGDYLFLDTDTIVTDDISEFDDFNNLIGAVEDMHQSSLKTSRTIDFVKDSCKKIGFDIDDSLPYYNSGIMYVKDSPETRDFYRKWHFSWSQNVLKGVFQDQIPLAQTNQDFKLITKISPFLHCQIMGNGLKYLHKAKILHFFNTNKNNSAGSVPFLFLDESIFLSIRKNGKITQEMKNDILNAKECFNERIELISGDAIPIFFSSMFRNLQKIYYRPYIWKFMINLNRNISQIKNFFHKK